MCENLIDPTLITGQTYSSQQSNFPATNIMTRTRRSKVWRTGGYWAITASNYGIVFQETVGVNLTAAIAVSNYVTDATFLTAIKTAMQAVGASTYTVTRDTTTNKIKISSNLGGGGGIFKLMCTNVAFTAPLGFSNGADLSGASNYTADVLSIHTSEWVRWDLGVASNPLAFILVGIRNQSIKISSTATMYLYANATDVWTSPSYSQLLTYNSQAILQMPLAGTQYRYWKLEIFDSANANGYVEVSNIYLGTYYEASRGGVNFPFASSLLDRSTTVFSESGQAFSDNREPGQEWNPQWNGITKTDVEKFDSYFLSLKTAYPFFFVADPDANFSSSSNYYTRMVRWVSPPDWKLQSLNKFDESMSLREEL